MKILYKKDGVYGLVETQNDLDALVRYVNRTAEPVVKVWNIRNGKLAQKTEQTAPRLITVKAV